MAPIVAAFAAGAVVGVLASRLGRPARAGKTFALADQQARFSAQKAAHSVRALDIEAIYDPGLLQGKRVLVTGGNRGIGLAIARELVQCGAETLVTCRKTSADLNALGVAQIIEGIDVQKDACMPTLARVLTAPIDILINNAGYFKKERESMRKKTMDFEDEMKTIDICCVGQLRVVSALYQAGLIAKGGKVAMITSQGGSVEWRDVQSPDGGDYGHHMSKAAANMGSKLLANEMKGEFSVAVLHPGFNKTGMTAKYADIWETEGAVEPSVGAKRICHEINLLSPATSGLFINCEDGLEIPW